MFGMAVPSHHLNNMNANMITLKAHYINTYGKLQSCSHKVFTVVLIHTTTQAKYACKQGSQIG